MKKRIFSVCLAFSLVLGMSAPANAQEITKPFQEETENLSSTEEGKKTSDSEIPVETESSDSQKADEPAEDTSLPPEETETVSESPEKQQNDNTLSTTEITDTAGEGGSQTSVQSTDEGMTEPTGETEPPETEEEPETPPFSGVCGADEDHANLTWVFDEATGTLTISGTGEMDNYTAPYHDPEPVFLLADETSSENEQDENTGEEDEKDEYLPPWEALKEDIFTVILEEGVTSLGSYAFYECTSLESIHLPESLTKLGEYAFSGCYQLNFVEIPSKITSIPEGIFEANEALSDISLPDTITEIGAKAFEYCGFTQFNVPVSVKTIGEYAFYDCLQMKEVFLPDDLENIGEWAFASTGLIQIEIPQNITALKRTFTDCEDLEQVTLPHGLITLGNETFWKCSSLNTVTLPDSVQEIGFHAFAECTSLTDIRLSANLTVIGDGAFCDCTKLRTIEIPEGVTLIERDAFRDCENLFYVGLSDSVKTIGDDAFGSTAIETIDLSNVTDLGKLAFAGCDQLKSVQLSDQLTEIKKRTFINCTSLTDINIPDSAAAIGEGAFMNCGSLPSVALPDGITNIGDSAFAGCIRMTEIHMPANLTKLGEWAFTNCGFLTEIEIPEQVTVLKEAVFQNCYDLENISLPKGLKTVEAYAFANCRSLTRVYYGGLCAEWDAVEINGTSNSELENALIYCADGYYGADIPDRPEIPDGIEKIYFSSYLNPEREILPLYENMVIKIFLKDSWLKENPDLIRKYQGQQVLQAIVKLVAEDGSLIYKYDYFPSYTEKSSEEGAYVSFSWDREITAGTILPNQTYKIQLCYPYNTVLSEYAVRSEPYERTSVGNPDIAISSDMVDDMFGKWKGHQLRKKIGTVIGSNGLCFGVSLVSSLMNPGGTLDASMLDGCTILNQAKLNTTMSGTSMENFETLIKKAHLLQYMESVQKEVEENRGNFEGLISELQGFKQRQNAMPVLYITGSEAQHSLAAFDYYTDDDTLYIYAQEINSIGMVAEFKITNYSDPDAAYWIYLNNDVYQGTPYTFSWVSASGVSEDGSQHPLLSAHKDVLAGALGIEKVNILHIAETSGQADTVNGDYLLSWISGTGTLEFSNISEDVSVADNHGIFVISKGAKGIFSMKSDVIQNISSSGDEISLSHKAAGTNVDGTECIVTVDFTGTTEEEKGNVTLTYDPESGKTYIEGAGKGTVTVSYGNEENPEENGKWTKEIPGNGSITVSADGTNNPDIQISENPSLPDEPSVDEPSNIDTPSSENGDTTSGNSGNGGSSEGASNGSSTTLAGNAVTGDSAPVLTLIVIALAATGIAGYTVIKMKRRKSESK